MPETLLPRTGKVRCGLVHSPAGLPSMVNVAPITAVTLPLVTRSFRAMEVTSPVKLWVAVQPSALQSISPAPSRVKVIPRSVASASWSAYSTRVSNILSAASARTGVRSMPSAPPVARGPVVTVRGADGVSPFSSWSFMSARPSRRSYASSRSTRCGFSFVTSRRPAEVSMPSAGVPFTVSGR